MCFPEVQHQGAQIRSQDDSHTTLEPETHLLLLDKGKTANAMSQSCDKTKGNSILHVIFSKQDP